VSDPERSPQTPALGKLGLFGHVLKTDMNSQGEIKLWIAEDVTFITLAVRDLHKKVNRRFTMHYIKLNQAYISFCDVYSSNLLANPQPSLNIWIRPL